MAVTLFVGAEEAGKAHLFPAPWDKVAHFCYYGTMAREERGERKEERGPAGGIRSATIKGERQVLARLKGYF
jgi:hypothetical protein